MLQSSHQMKRDLVARQRFQASNHQRKIEAIAMAENSITQHSFLEQVASLAPTIHYLLNTKTARITAAVASHDVTGGYGRGFTFHLKLELLVEQCLMCFETQWSAPSFDCRWHRLEKRFMQIADAEAVTLEKALAKIEAAISFGRELRRAA